MEAVRYVIEDTKYRSETAKALASVVTEKEKFPG